MENKSEVLKEVGWGLGTETKSECKTGQWEPG